MDLIEFSVTNFRSITTAHKIKLQDFTVLVGKNNEGKSNLLNALNAAMSIMMNHSMRFSRSRRDVYDWERDFPIQCQNRKHGLESIFKLHFRLKPDELDQFHSITGIRGNEDIPISIKVGMDNMPHIEIPKRGSSSYNRKSQQVTQFISERINFNYIQAIRTENMAKTTLSRIINSQLENLKDNPEYTAAIDKIKELQQNLLDGLSTQLLEPLQIFLPNLTGIHIQLNPFQDNNYIGMHNNFDIFLNDGTSTNISTKGDGIKSLVTLALLKARSNKNGTVSVIAIEAPESHLHPGAIHNLVDVLNKISENNQVIITTHNPLFVQRNKLSSNIIVDSNTAKTAKSISDIRNILGVWTSDNLTNARYVLVVEGEDDKISLSKLLPHFSAKLSEAIRTNMLVIKSLGGAGNLCHDINDLRSSMCQYVVLLDNDDAGKNAAQKALDKNLLKNSEVKYTICNGSPEAEFEDCLNPNFYAEVIKNEFSVDINCQQFRGNKKWSERMKNTFLSQGSQWNDEVEEKVKYIIAQTIPSKITESNDILISAKSGFLNGLVTALESMLVKETKQ